MEFSNPHDDELLHLMPDDADDIDDSKCDHDSDYNDDNHIANENSSQLHTNEGAHDDMMPNE